MNGKDAGLRGCGGHAWPPPASVYDAGNVHASPVPRTVMRRGQHGSAAVICDAGICDVICVICVICDAGNMDPWPTMTNPSGVTVGAMEPSLSACWATRPWTWRCMLKSMLYIWNVIGPLLPLLMLGPGGA